MELVVVRAMMAAVSIATSTSGKDFRNIHEITAYFIGQWKSRACLTPEGKAMLTPENFFILTPLKS